MKIKEITNQSQWQRLFDEAGSPSFLHSWEWGEFEKKQGYSIQRLCIETSGKPVAIALIVKIRSKRGDFLLIPHGPLFKAGEPTATIRQAIQELTRYGKEIAQKEHFLFIRIAPVQQTETKAESIYSDLGFRRAPIYMHAERAWVLPLEKSEDELLADMRKTTRYSIKKARRDGVKVITSTDPHAIDTFMKIYDITSSREHFVAFSKQFIRDEFESFQQTGNAAFFQAVHPQGVLASSLVIFTKSAAFYHQGASIHSKIPAPYLLQWEAIREAKKRGCRFYNFWGILKPGRTPRAWSGLTLFKQGFGGFQVDYIPTQDYIFSPRYYLTWLYEKYLNLRRGV